MAEKARPSMPISNRAKQFAPFSALKGLEEAIEEKRIKKTQRLTLTERQAEILNSRLARLSAGDTVYIMHYTRGGYIKRTVRVYDVDISKKAVVTDGENIFFEDIYAIKKQAQPAPSCRLS